MDRIALYHQGTPLTYHTVLKDSFTIGSHPENDLVLASDGVRERHLVIYKAEEGKWRAEHVGYPVSGDTDLTRDTRLVVGNFSLSVEPSKARQESSRNEAPTKSPLRLIPDLDWAGRSVSTLILKVETQRLAPLRAPVLITGESGTGKELVARGLHRGSDRKDQPFVPINCGGLTESLLEDTLFGHASGAFTGAGESRKGVFEQAEHGVVFLDEIGELPLSQQASLLRVLDDRRVRRIGSERTIGVDFRLVTATNRDIKKLVRRNKFRLDLYHRIATLTLATTPLRDRPEDVLDLVRHFFHQFTSELGERQADGSALDKLTAYDWPGNVRELRNVLYRAAAFTDRRIVTASDIDIPNCSPKKIYAKLNSVTDNQLKTIMEAYSGNVTRAARALNVPRSTLRDRVVQMELR